MHLNDRFSAAVVPELDTTDAVLTEVAATLRQPKVFGLVTVLDDEDIPGDGNATEDRQASLGLHGQVELARRHKLKFDFRLMLVVGVFFHIPVDF